MRRDIMVWPFRLRSGRGTLPAIARVLSRAIKVRMPNLPVNATQNDPATVILEGSQRFGGLQLPDSVGNEGLHGNSLAGGRDRHSAAQCQHAFPHSDHAKALSMVGRQTGTVVAHAHLGHPGFGGSGSALAPGRRLDLEPYPGRA